MAGSVHSRVHRKGEQTVVLVHKSLEFVGDRFGAFMILSNLPRRAIAAHLAPGRN